ncbi:MAG: YjgF/chorismate mutase-like, putative endoribonuclease, partial [Armatimonadota bacterium]
FVLGEIGRHAWTCVGAARLPGNFPVEIDMVVVFDLVSVRPCDIQKTPLEIQRRFVYRAW